MFSKLKLAAVAGVAMGCLLIASTAAAQAVISFNVAAVGASGITGSGTLVAAATDTESTMNVQFQGLQPGSVHLVSQFHGTSCAAHDAAPEFVFSAVTADSQGKAAALLTVKKPFKNWPNRPHFLVLYATDKDSSAEAACGMITAVALATPTVAATTAPTPVAPAAPSTGSGLQRGSETREVSRVLPLALAVVALGLGGTLAYAVAQRRR